MEIHVHNKWLEINLHDFVRLSLFREHVLSLYQVNRVDPIECV